MNFSRRNGTKDPVEAHAPSGTVYTFTGTVQIDVTDPGDVLWLIQNPQVQQGTGGAPVTPAPVDEGVFLRDGILVKRNPAGSGVVEVDLGGGASVITSKGDLIVGDATGTPVRLPAGTAGQVLTRDATQPAGVKWATPAAAVGETLRLAAEGDIAAGGGTFPVPILKACTVTGVTPSCRTDRYPQVPSGQSGQPAIGDLRRYRPSDGTTVSLFSDDGHRPQIPAGSFLGSKVTPNQNAGLLAGDVLLGATVQGGVTTASPNYVKSWAGSGATTGTGFTIARPGDMALNSDDPPLVWIALTRNNKTTQVTTPDGMTRVWTADGNGAWRNYLYCFPDDLDPDGWDFGQDGAAGIQAYAITTTQQTAADVPFEDVQQWLGSSTPSADYTVPAVTLAGPWRTELSFIFGSAGVDHRNMPTSGGAWGAVDALPGRVGVIRRYPGNVAAGTVAGPYTGGKFKDASNADTSVSASVVTVAVGPKAVDPGADFMQTVETVPA